VAPARIANLTAKARIYGLEKDLGISDGTYNASLSIFFISYALLEPLTNVLLKRFRPSVFLPLIMTLWGVCMTSVRPGQRAQEIELMRTDGAVPQRRRADHGAVLPGRRRGRAVPRRQRECPVQRHTLCLTWIKVLPLVLVQALGARHPRRRLL
jgi:hypothetical protein